MADLYRFFGAALFFAFVYAYGLRWLLFLLLRKLGFIKRKPRGTRSRIRRGVHFGVLAAGAVGLFCMAWGFIEPYFPVVETVQIESVKITAPIRLVHISDLHCDPKVRAEEKVVRMIELLKPDLIVFTGDGVNSDAGIPVFKRTMRALSKVAPLYGVRGNWEAWWFTHVDTFKNTGLMELNGEVRALDISGQKIWITGVAVDEEHRLKRALNAMPKDAFRIVLHHYPGATELVDGRADLLLSGDTHGGQLRLPLLGPLIRIRRWGGPFYGSGLHHTARGLHTYVNRGIGMEGQSVPRVRFLTPPEVTLIELQPKQAVRTSGVRSGIRQPGLPD